MNEPEPVKLLLVDDLPDNLTALDALLRQDDVAILQAGSGREALELLLVHDVALAILDVQMPEMDGFELAELMRGSERTRHIPIIFVTAGARESHRIFQGYDAGAVDFLFKPVEAHVLRNKVATFVELHRQRLRLSAQLQRERASQRERERLVTELQETLRLNELFIAVLGHDLRNPLSAIRFSAEGLLRRVADPEAHKIAERLRSVSDRMARMIAELLDLARARLGGGIPVNAQSMDLGSLTRRTVEELVVSHPDRQIDVSTEGNCVGFWDEDRLAQVLSNLVGNALQHGTSEAPVEVRIDGRHARDVQISVSNGGVLSPEAVPTLFDPFRGNTTGSRGAGGLGLGLYIVQQIVQAHGGQVHASSEGGRTFFRVELSRGTGSDRPEPVHHANDLRVG